MPAPDAPAAATDPPANARQPQAASPAVVLAAPPASYRTASYLQAADDLGLRTVVLSRGQAPLVSRWRQGIAVDPAKPGETARVASLLRPLAPAAVVATDDATVELAAGLSARLALAHNPPGAARLSRRKDLARAALARAGVRVPPHAVIRLDDPLPRAARGYPCVVKPLALSASRGVIRADDGAGLAAACARIRRLVADRPARAERELGLVEQFVPGIEVALEGLLTAGRLRTLAVFDKPDELNGPYFEETYYITPSRLPADTLSLVEREVTAACAAYGLRHGPVHAECRINAQGVWILEVAARTIGGLCARLFRLGAGQGLEETVLEHAIGRQPMVRERRTAAGVLMLPVREAGVLRRVEGIGAARAVPGVEDVVIDARSGQTLVPLPEGDSYLGFVFAAAGTPAAVEAALRTAHEQLNIVTAPALQVSVAGAGTQTA